MVLADFLQRDNSSINLKQARVNNGVLWDTDKYDETVKIKTN